MSEARSDTPSIAARLRLVSEGAPAAFAAHFISDTTLFVLGEECLLIVPRQGDPGRFAVHAGAILCSAGEAGRVLTGGDDGMVMATDPSGASTETTDNSTAA